MTIASTWSGNWPPRSVSPGIRECGPAVDVLNLRIDATPWGVGFVEITDRTYEPSEVGALL